MNDKSDKRPDTEESGDLIQTEQKSQRILGRDEPGIFDHDVETAGSFKSRGGGLNQFAGPLSLESWLEIPHRDADPTAWGVNERGRCFFHTTPGLFKFWDGTQFLGLVSGPVEGFAEGAIPFGGVGGGFLDEDNVNLIWNDALDVLEVMAPTRNTYIGKGVISAGNSTGHSNVYVGYEAGRDNTSGVWNVIVGCWAGYKNTSGLYNTLVGYYAGYEITTSQFNTCIGANAGQTISTGQGLNVCIGAGAGTHTTGRENVSVGVYSGTIPTTGSRNTCVGYNAEADAANAWYRIAIGYQAISKENNLCVIGGNTSAASVNLAIFYNREFRFYDDGNNYVGFKAPALVSNKIWVLPATDGGAGEAIITDAGGNLSFTGSPVLLDSDFGSAGFMMTDGAGAYSILPGGENLTDHNLLIGTDAGVSLTATLGLYNILIGEGAGNALTTADYNVHIGFEAGYYGDTESFSVYMGYQAGKGNGAGQGGIACIGIGYQALWRANGCSSNVAIGMQAGRLITSGSYNFALGSYALGAITTQARNIGIGAQAGQYYAHTQSTMIGYFAGAGSVDVRLVAIGDSAGRGKTAGGSNFSDCTFVGAYSGGNSVCDQVSIYNTGVGSWSLYSINGGDNNVAIGYKAGYHITTGIGNVCIGYMAGETNLTTDSNELWIANTNTATPLIYGEFPNTLFRITATNSYFLGITNLGDGGITNYASFAADGELTLFGTAKVIRDLWIPFNALKTPGIKPATYADHGISGAWSFADATDDTIVANIKFPNDMDKSVAPTIAIGWSSTTPDPGDDSKQAVWQLEYLYRQIGEDTTVVAQGTLPITVSASTVAEGLVYSVFAALDVLHADDICLHLGLKRLGADPDDDLGDTAELHGLCLQYTSNKLGTAT